jgi:gliding motility-associated-like protein
VTISYIDQNNNPVPTPFPNPFLTATQSITATITNNTSQACNYATSINFVVDTVPQVVPLPISWTSICDDELDVLAQNGSVAFDTSSFQSTLVGNQTNVIVNYFDQQNNPLPSPLPNPFISGSQNITVVISNANNTSCKINYTIPLKVIERPIINPIGQELICSNNANFIRIIDAALVNPASSLDYSYEWSLNNSIIPNQTQYTLAINIAGSYEVTVTNSDGCKSTRTIEVTASNTATIDNIEIKDLQANNTISVFVSGLGNYVYSLDNQNFQSENTFTEVVPGFYTVYVKDLNQCGIVSEQISVLGIPSFFTPNGDGANDTWFITGINNQFNTKSIISIFDRYGKLLTQFKAYGSGWDGTSNGQTMPSDDYWYTVQLQDGRTIKGHFALKR